ncbi:MAG: Permease, drug/metabolite transporter superfamily [Parcubacteria group bacterium GW2011_GWA1_47_8]|nr:MAG: Permease, drug/metabolite transporter superfamily [Parcubacteria group bacterium GW2011_GWA1_47_8]KKW07221.1 MAG: Permease, drug/metabolite transporter superfamily [Parcubacteria group bacterium GW2011_GWA2_49_16]
MWLFYAFFSAFTAALVAIFAKLGLKDIDSTLATTVRAVIMAVFLVSFALALKKFDGFTVASFTGREWVLIILSGIAGAFSWLFYFFALKSGTASQVVAIDKLSVVMVVILAVVFLGETLTWKTGIGAALMTVGAILMVLT